MIRAYGQSTSMVKQIYKGRLSEATTYLQYQLSLQN